MGSFLIGSSNAFILIVLCGAFDFWVVKNITGRYFKNIRLLVGMRWWVEHDKLGKEKYVFEAKGDQTKMNPYDSKIFWGS